MRQCRAEALVLWLSHFVFVLMECVTTGRDKDTTVVIR